MTAEPLLDRDPGDETHNRGDLCAACKENLAAPNDEFCRPCLFEIEAELYKLEQEAKRARQHADLWAELFRRVAA